MGCGHARLARESSWARRYLMVGFLAFWREDPTLLCDKEMQPHQAWVFHPPQWCLLLAVAFPWLWPPGSGLPFTLLMPSPGTSLPSTFVALAVLYLLPEWPPLLMAVLLVLNSELYSSTYLVQYFPTTKRTSKAFQRVPGFCVLTSSQSLSVLEEKTKAEAELKVAVVHQLGYWQPKRSRSKDAPKTSCTSYSNEGELVKHRIQTNRIAE